MAKHWTQSSLPYFVMVKDESEIQSNTFRQAGKQTLNNASNSDSNHASSSVLASSKQYYPEIRYVFKDDPNYYDLETTFDENEDTIIIDFDELGENILKYQSQSPELQVTDISVMNKNSTKNIVMKTTRPELQNFETLKPTKDFEYINKLIELYKIRNSQLEALLK